MIWRNINTECQYGKSTRDITAECQCEMQNIIAERQHRTSTRNINVKCQWNVECHHGTSTERQHWTPTQNISVVHQQQASKQLQLNMNAEKSTYKIKTWILKLPVERLDRQVPSLWYRHTANGKILHYVFGMRLPLQIHTHTHNQ